MLVQDDLFGSWICSGWLKSFWVPGCFSTQLLIADDNFVSGYRVVGDIVSDSELSFDVVNTTVCELRREFSVGSIITNKNTIGSVVV